MAIRLRTTCAFVFACIVSSTSAGATRPYTVDDLLSLESIGTARFNPSGDHLIFERFGPFDQQSDFSRFFVIGEQRSKLYVVDLTTNGAPQPLFAQDRDAGYTLDGISPDGNYVLFQRLSTDGLALGGVPLSGGASRRFAFSADYNVREEIPWAGHGVVAQALPDGEAAPSAAIQHENVDEVIARWRHAHRGDVATAAVIGSGHFAMPAHRDGELVLADTETGTVRPLASGRFTVWFPAPGGQAFAALREDRLEIDPNRPLEHGANIGGIQRRLLILPAGGGSDAAPREACPGCDVLASSLNWSATAPLLAFYARDEGAEWTSANYRVYDNRTGRSRPIDLGDLRIHVGRAGIDMDVRATWIGDRLAVLAQPASSIANHEARADWYLLGDGAPRNLTGALAGASPELVGVTRTALVVLQGGDAWRIDADGNRHNLTADIAQPVRAWRAPSPYAYLPPENIQPADTVALQVNSETAGQPDRLLFVDVETGGIETITAPSSDSAFVAVSPAAHRAALTTRDHNVTTLMIVDTSGAHRELARINERLRDVVGGTPVRIDHKGPHGDDRMSWILLPPNYRRGHPVPTIVNVYPGSVGHETWTRWQLDQMHPLNDHLLAARGYAVLYPSIPVHYEDVPRDPLTGLTDEVFAAVDAAVAAGYADPQHLAVQGQSYGGYTTGALVGLTNRFRTAVAQAGLYDLISSYGTFDIRRRLDAERTGLDMFAASLMETSQGGMGAPPWVDPERYLRNSPLMHVADVHTPIMLMSGDLDYVSTTQSEEFFTALTRLNRDAVFVRYYGEDHIFNSPANIRDMWHRIFDWYDRTLAPASISGSDR